MLNPSSLVTSRMGRSVRAFHRCSKGRDCRDRDIDLAEIGATTLSEVQEVEAWISCYLKRYVYFQYLLYAYFSLVS